MIRYIGKMVYWNSNMKNNNLIREGWDNLEERLLAERNEAFTRLLPLFYAAKRHSFLPTLFLFTSHEILRFNSIADLKSMDHFPCARAIPGMTEGNMLRALPSCSGLEVDVPALINYFFQRYRFLAKHEQPFFEKNIKNEITGINDIVQGVEWIFERSYGMYAIGTNLHACENADIVLSTTESAGFLADSIMQS